MHTTLPRRRCLPTTSESLCSVSSSTLGVMFRHPRHSHSSVHNRPRTLLLDRFQQHFVHLRIAASISPLSPFLLSVSPGVLLSSFLITTHIHGPRVVATSLRRCDVPLRLAHYLTVPHSTFGRVVATPQKRCDVPLAYASPTYLLQSFYHVYIMAPVFHSIYSYRPNWVDLVLLHSKRKQLPRLRGRVTSYRDTHVPTAGLPYSSSGSTAIPTVIHRYVLILYLFVFFTSKYAARPENHIQGGFIDVRGKVSLNLCLQDRPHNSMHIDG